MKGCVFVALFAVCFALPQHVVPAPFDAEVLFLDTILKFPEIQNLLLSSGKASEIVSRVLIGLHENNSNKVPTCEKAAYGINVRRVAEDTIKIDVNDVALKCYDEGKTEAHLVMSFNVTSNKDFGDYQFDGSIDDIRVVEGPTQNFTTSDLSEIANIRQVLLSTSSMNDDVWASLSKLPGLSSFLDKARGRSGSSSRSSSSRSSSGGSSSSSGGSSSSASRSSSSVRSGRTSRSSVYGGVGGVVGGVMVYRYYSMRRRQTPPYTITETTLNEDGVGRMKGTLQDRASFAPAKQLCSFYCNTAGTAAATSTYAPCTTATGSKYHGTCTCADGFTGTTPITLGTESCPAAATSVAATVLADVKTESSASLVSIESELTETKPAGEYLSDAQLSQAKMETFESTADYQLAREQFCTSACVMQGETFKNTTNNCQYESGDAVRNADSFVCYCVEYTDFLVGSTCDTGGTMIIPYPDADSAPGVFSAVSLAVTAVMVLVMQGM